MLVPGSNANGASPAARLPLIIGVTGHRDIPQDDHDAVEAACISFFSSIADQYTHTPLYLLSGLAEGADRIAASAFLKLRAKRSAEFSDVCSCWKLVAVLPMPDETYRNDFPGSILEFDDILSASSAVIDVHSNKIDRLSLDSAERVATYAALARHLVRHCNIIMALWDGIQLSAQGGTSHVVRMKLHGVETRGSRHISSLHDSGPVWHIPVRRLGGALGPTESKPHWLYPSELTITANSIDESFRQIDELNSSLIREADPKGAVKAAGYLSPSPIAHKALLSAAGVFDRQIVSLAGAIDALTVTRDKRRRKLTRVVYACSLAVGLFLWSALDGVAQILTTAGYVVSLGLTALIYRRLKSPMIAEAPLHYRFLVEALRVQVYWSLGRQSDHGVDPAEPSAPLAERGSDLMSVLDGLMSQQVHEIGWVREALRMCAIDPSGCIQVSDEVRAEHVRHWILDQHKYFKKTEIRYDLLGRRLSLIRLISILFGVVTAAGAVGLDLFDIDLHILRHILAVSAAALPASAILLESYSNSIAVEEQAKNALRMQLVFDRTRQILKAERPDHLLPNRLVRSLGEEALLECANWLVLRKSKPPSMPT